MKIIDLKKDLIDQLVEGCKKHLYYLIADLSGQSIFSYTIYCDSGCRNMGVALCTREWLVRRNRNIVSGLESSWYGEVNSAEWNYVNKYYELFDDVDDQIDKLYDIFYDGELDDVKLNLLDSDRLWEFICNFFVDVVAETLIILKKSGHFSNKLFENDLLLGMQFSDPDKHSLGMVEAASNKVNSLEWHKKIILNCDLIRSAAE